MREADCRAHDSRFGQWCVNDPLCPELGLQPVGHPEDAAEPANVLADEHHAVVGGHRRAESLVDRLRQAEFRHARLDSSVGCGASSYWSRQATYSACCARNSSVCSAKTLSNHAARSGSGMAKTRCAHRLAQLVGLTVDAGEERFRLRPPFEQGAHAGDRVTSLPRLDLGGVSIPRGVVGCGVRADAICQRLDERRPATVAGPPQRRLRDGLAGKHVVAIDLNAGHAESVGSAHDGHRGLAAGRQADRVLIVLAEEDNWR